MKEMTPEIILASQSPRRKNLMERTGLPFTVIVSESAEDTKETEPGRIVMELSLQKAAAVAKMLTEDFKETTKKHLVIGADTIVWAEGRVLGKPADREDARRMIRMLEGRSHSVYTGVTVLEDCPENCEGTDKKTKVNTGILPEGWSAGSQFFCETKVKVRPMTPEEIESYLDTGEAYDKAGAYGIQGAFGAYVEGIEGDYNNVVGLPVDALKQVLDELIGKEK